MFMNTREKGVLMIGGASRNVGKTTFSCKVIEHFSKEYPIVGLKVKTIYEGDNFFHGKDRTPLESDFRLIEEFEDNTDEDTAKMLRSGAKHVFRLKVKNTALEKAFYHFKKQLEDDYLIICESNSLREVFKPDIFILIKHKHNGEMKPSATKLEKYADKIVLTDGTEHDFSFTELRVKDGMWMI